MFFFFAGPFIPALYIGAHLLSARKVPLVLRVTGVLLLLAISQIYPINISLFKNLSGPDMPAWLLKAQTALFAALVMLFLFLLARDVLSLAAFLGRVLFRKKAAAAPPESPSRRNFAGRTCRGLLDGGSCRKSRRRICWCRRRDGVPRHPCH